MSAASAFRPERLLVGIPPRAVELFLRSRQAWQAPLGFVLIAAVGTGFVRRYDDESIAQTTALVLCPLLAACLIGAGAGSPFGEPERTAALPLPALRLGHLAGLLLLAAACLLGANALFPWVDSPLARPRAWMATDAVGVTLALLRNLIGLTGLALLTSRVLGAGLAWVAPLGYGLLSLVVGLMVRPATGGDLVIPAWAVPVLPAGERIASGASVTLLIVGLALVARSGASDARGDEAA